LRAVFSPPEAISASVRHAVGTDATGPNMHQQPAAGQRPRQAPGQPGPVCQLAQQDQARVHHDPRPAPGNFQPPRPCDNVHSNRAPRTGTDRTSAILIVPVQEHHSSQARPAALNPNEFLGLTGQVTAAGGRGHLVVVATYSSPAGAYEDRRFMQ
jgi:hypothetical protein